MRSWILLNLALKVPTRYFCFPHLRDYWIKAKSFGNSLTLFTPDPCQELQKNQGKDQGTFLEVPFHIQRE